MSNNYIKISQVDKLPLESLLTDDSLVELNGLDINCNLLNLAKSTKFITNDNILPKESIALTLLNGIELVALKLKSIESELNKKLYLNVNDTIPQFQDLDSEDIVIAINNYKRNVNNLFLSALIIDNTEAVQQDENIIQELEFHNQNITALELNLQALEKLVIKNCSSLFYFNIGSCTKLKHLELSGTYCSNAIRVGKLDTNPFINLSDNIFYYIELIGNNSVLNLDNCILAPQKAGVLKYVKFKDCIVSDDLIQSLKVQNIQVEVE